MACVGFVLLCLVALTSVYAKDIGRNTIDAEENNDDVRLVGGVSGNLLGEMQITVSEEMKKKPAKKGRNSNKPVEERSIEQQVKKLKNMKCKPYRQKIYVRDILDGTDSKIDASKPIFPEVLSVKRCDPKCSYCFDRLGREKGTCQPARNGTKKYTIRTYDERGNKVYFKVPVEIHKRCECKSKQS